MDIEENLPIVVVSGATGYIAAHIVEQLLATGRYRVRGTARSPNDASKVGHLLRMPNANRLLTLVKADLLDPESCKAACAGATYVLHTASPFILQVEDPQKDLVDPAVSGTLAFLNGAADAGTVQRVVLTSSVAAILNAPKSGHVYTEADWNTESSLAVNPYYFSKTEAEKAAWELAKERNIDLVAVNPFLVVGPSHLPSLGESSEVLVRILNKEFPGIVDFHWGMVDVRDVAAAHILAMEKPEANGRYLTCGHAIYMREICNLFGENFPEYPLPTASLDTGFGTALTKAFSYTEKKQVGMYIRSNVGVKFEFDNSKIRTLGMEFRPIEETLLDSANDLIYWGHVAEKRKSRLSDLAIANINADLNRAFPEPFTGTALLAWLKQHLDHKSDTRTLRDAEALLERGAIIPQKPTKAGFKETRLYSAPLVQQLANLPVPEPLAVGDELPAEYRVVLEESLAELLQIGPGGLAEGWKNVRLDHGVLIQQRKVEGNPINQMKGSGKISAPASTIAKEAANFEKQCEWDPLMSKATVLHTYADGTSVRLVEYQARSCIVKTRRHFIVLMKQFERDGNFYVVSRSVTYGAAPPPPANSVEAFAGPTGWIVAPEGDNLSRVTYLCQANLNGLPVPVINIVQKKQPLLIASLSRYLTGKDCGEA